MFEVKTKAEIKNLNVRRQTHGDEFVPADDIKLMLMSVPVEKITSACPEIKQRFYDDSNQVAVGEILPLVVKHELKNIDVTIGAVKLKGVSIKKKMKINLLPDHRANVECQISVPELTLVRLCSSDSLTVVSRRWKARRKGRVNERLHRQFRTPLAGVPEA